MFRTNVWPLALIPASVLMAVVMTSPIRAQRPEPARTAAAQPPAAEKVVRGRYIVEDVAMCGRCHTPVDAHGNRDTTRWLRGGAVGISPTVPTDNWAILAPRIAGTPPGTDEEFVHLLMTGESRFSGRQLRQPMPQFRMSQEDAEAVLAYLKSLGVRSGGTE